MNDREWYVKELARNAALTPHVEKLGLPEGAEVTSFYLSDTPWEDWGMTDEGETHFTGTTLTLYFHFLINGAGRAPLQAHFKYFEAEHAIEKVSLIHEILLDALEQRG
jgi:hypothetical protein